MNDLSLNVVLAYEHGRMGKLQSAAHDLLGEAKDVSSDLTDVQRRAEALKQKLGFDFDPSPVTQTDTRPPPQTLPVSWEPLVEEANEWLTENNPNSEVDINALLRSEKEAKRIDELHGGTFDGRVQLDAYDIAAAVTAGVAGALTDLIVVKTPAGAVWNGELQTASHLTLKLRENAMQVDNWMSGLFKVPFDRVNNTGIAGMGPQSHRVQTFGHDPLLGWALGTLDIMRGTLTGVDTNAAIHVVQTGNPTPDLLAALGLQAGHLLSDVFTRMGLPLPGWTALLAVPLGEFGPHNRTVGQMARWMYMRGYGTWHLLTMATSVAVTEAFIRAYYALRQLLDDEYRHIVEVERLRSRAEQATAEPRYRSLSLLAHAIAAAGNAGKIALHGGNPLALNIAQWAMLARRIVQKTQIQPISETLMNQHAANRAVIQTGWTKLSMDVSQPIGD